MNSASVIEIGDLVYQEVDDVRAAGDLTYGASLTATQLQFVKQFVGVAMRASANGETTPAEVAQAGVFEFNCAAATFEIGDLVGPDDNAGGTALTPQQVIAMSEQGVGGIGTVVKRYSANTTRVLVEIFPQHRALMAPQIITLYNGIIGTAGDLVTAWPVPFPFKLLELRSITTVAHAGSTATVLNVEKNTTDLDDTMTIATSSPIGDVDRAVMDDATGDDIFNMGDTLSIETDGGADSGESLVQIIIAPFRNES